jgi:hypothetical protein
MKEARFERIWSSKMGFVLKKRTVRFEQNADLRNSHRITPLRIDKKQSVAIFHVGM